MNIRQKQRNSRVFHACIYFHFMEKVDKRLNNFYKSRRIHGKVLYMTQPSVIINEIKHSNWDYFQSIHFFMFLRANVPLSVKTEGIFKNPPLPAKTNSMIFVYNTDWKQSCYNWNKMIDTYSSTPYVVYSIMMKQLVLVWKLININWIRAKE